ncbi:unnamed protein product [Arctia plantaginis]|uniref:Uncharacterized protein n=1 Tax=Arctia plantaginis TaxID=874455 RepID=A0A8S0YTE3_ARCPL|nr:unnamed protein product [Arctia plantaginis]
MHDACRNIQTPTNTPPASPVTLEQAAIANELQQLINSDYESEVSHDDSVEDPDFTPETLNLRNVPVSSPSPPSPSVSLTTPSDLRSVETVNLFGHDSSLRIDRSDIFNISFQMTPDVEAVTSTSALPSAVNSPGLSTSSATSNVVNSPTSSSSRAMPSVVNLSTFGDEAAQPTSSNRGRAKRKNEHSWKQNIRKKLRNSGKEQMVRTALYKKRRSVAEIASPDKRGKHSPGIQLPDVLVEHANSHIEYFPTVPSHWCRKDTKKVYLEPILNQEKMYNLYLDKCQQDNIVKPISKTSYREMLLKKNIAFHKPRKDQCWCHHYEMLPEDQREEKKEEYRAHVKRKQEANAEKAEDKKKAEQDHSYMSVNFDMEAVLYSPLLLGKPVFYKRKIACFNFTVFDTATKQGYCYKWPEYEGNRGANEVSTCLNLFLKQVPTHVSHVVLHSDCCPGQNRNSILLYMLMTLQSSNDCTIDVIDLKFLEPGHTHMECDNMHAAIERASESARIFIPDDWL